MSAEAVGWAFKHSPFKGATQLVLLALADSANDQHRYELWMRQHKLARKARVGRNAVGKALAELEAAGVLEYLEGGQATGEPKRYRLHLLDLPVHYEPKAQGGMPSKAKREGGAPVEGTPTAGTPAPPEGTGCTPGGQGGAPPGGTGCPPSARSNPTGTQGEEPKVEVQVLERAWERLDPKPATPWPGLLQVTRRLLGAGWHPDDVEEALVRAPTISTGACEIVLRGSRRATRRAQVDNDRGGPSGEVKL